MLDGEKIFGTEAPLKNVFHNLAEELFPSARSHRGGAPPHGHAPLWSPPPPAVPRVRLLRTRW